MAADFVHPDACDEYRHVFVDVMAGMWFTLFFAVYVIAAAVLYYRQRPQVINELITFATEYGQVQKHLIQELALPYAVMDSQGKLLWVNKEFTKITGKDTQYHKCIATIFQELTVERLPKMRRRPTSTWLTAKRISVPM